MQSCEGFTRGIRIGGQYMAERESVPCANIMAGWAVWIAGEVITSYPITRGWKCCQPLRVLSYMDNYL